MLELNKLKRGYVMERAALYHRPDSEYAYLYESEKMHIRLRTKKMMLNMFTLLKATRI